MKFRYMISVKNTFLILGSVLLISSCNHDFSWIEEHRAPRAEYAPNMYHSVAYEPLTQVVDEGAGSWLSSDEKLDNQNYGKTYGEYFNSNIYNADSSNGYTPLNSRVPVKGTIKRGFIPYHLSKESLDSADRSNKSPLAMSPAILEEGKVLFSKFCQHCHGEAGDGKGPVSEKFAGVANLTSGGMKVRSEGYIFHVITMGKGLMASHASQLNQEERWKIAHYVKQQLQK
jgi:cytochrome c2